MEPNQIEDYEYDSLDNIKRVTEIKGTKIAETNYTYDKDSRLLLQDTINGSEETQQRFTYDGNGNQTSKDEVIKRNGSTVSSKSSTYWFNGFNQLSRVRDPNGKFIDYTYNGQGLRTKKDFGDKATNYYYDGGNIIMETDQNNRSTAKNIRGLRLIYRENNPDQTNEQFLYYLHNAHGDVTQLLNEKGQVIQDYRYDTFGKEKTPESQVFGGKQSTEMWRKEVEKIDNPFRYAGEYLDEETGNYYLRARYYDPSTQRFISEDSYGVALGAAWRQSLYGYVGNNPINRIDPSGHISLKLGSKGARVKELQTMLMALGYALPKYGNDSDFGNETLAAVNRFKKDNRLGNTGAWYGIVGDQTWGVLKTAYDKSSWSGSESNLMNPKMNGALKRIKPITKGTRQTGTQAATVNLKANTGNQSQAFYTDGGAGFSAFGKKAGYFKGASGPTSGVEAKIFGETGLATVTSEGQYGKIGAKAVGASAEASLGISKVPEASLYGKAYLANVSSSGYIPLPFTNHKIEVGFEADVVSIGGGVVISAKDMRAKVGAHFGIGSDLIVGLK